MNGGRSWRSKIANEHQRLQVIGEAVKSVRKSSVVREIFQRIANFEHVVVRAMDIIVHKWVIHPLANLVRNGGDVLRERSCTAHISCVGISLPAGLNAVGAMIAADAAPDIICQIYVIRNE